MAVTAVVVGAACSASSEQRPVRDPTRISQLGIFMKTYMNPPFSKISFLLFHDGEEEAEITADQLPTSAADLAKAAERLTKWPDLPGESPQSKQVFTEYAEALKTDTRNLVEALRRDPEAAIKVFDSLRKKCDSCHHFFRFDESTSVQPGAAAPAKRK